MSDFKNIAVAVRGIKMAQGTLTKKDLLSKSASITGFKTVMEYIYNPYKKNGISAKKLETVNLMIANLPATLKDSSSVDEEYRFIVKYLTTHTTGDTTDLNVAANFKNSIMCCEEIIEYQDEMLELADAIITQDLSIGVDVKTLNAVYGKDFIPTIGCMLGTRIGDKATEIKVDKIQWPVIITEKLDGVRRILIKENGVCRFYSRSGHEDTGLSAILADAKYLPNNRVYDGELLAAGTFKDSIAQRQATNSLAAGSGEKRGLVFHVFDMLSVEDFWKGKSTENALERKTLLAATFMDYESLDKLAPNTPYLAEMYGMQLATEHIKVVPVLGIADSNQFNIVQQLAVIVWECGGEGLMLNTAKGLYEKKRSKALIKLKKTKEYKLKVVGFSEGTGLFEGVLGALLVDYNGTILGVGSGIGMPLRRAIWNNKDAYINKWIEVDSFGESTNKVGIKSLNCPIFKRFVGQE